MNARAKLLRIVENARGDDLERAQRAFQGMSTAELDAEYGSSGKTRVEVLGEYVRERADWRAARDLATGLVGDAP